MEITGEGAEELGKQTLAFMGELHSQKRFLSSYLTRAEDITVSAESGLTFSMGLRCFTSAILDLWVAACAGNIPKAISTSLFPSAGTNSPVSLQCSLASNTLLHACVVRREYTGT